jgi:coenzyme PQQ synthesis protein D (PqqD)
MRPSPDVVWRELEGEAVLLDLGSGIYFGLNEVGTRIWQLLDQGCATEAVLSTIVGEFEVDRAEAEDGFRRLIDELRARGLVIDAAAQGSAS